MMTDSKETAAAVAHQELGYDVKIVGTGAVVTAVQPGRPGRRACSSVGDTIIVGGRHPDHPQRPAGSGHQRPRAGRRRHARGAAAPRERGRAAPPRPARSRWGPSPTTRPRACLGVVSGTRDLHYDLPVQVTIDSGSVGGPSAGLAFTLGIMDVLTPGSITGGHKVATTGTINPDGTVGPVGGVHQKTVAVRESGAELFLVPSSEYDEAEKYAGSLRVEPVDTVERRPRGAGHHRWRHRRGPDQLLIRRAVIVGRRTGEGGSPICAGGVSYHRPGGSHLVRSRRGLEPRRRRPPNRSPRSARATTRSRSRASWCRWRTSCARPRTAGPGARAASCGRPRPRRSATASSTRAG